MNEKKVILLLLCSLLGLSACSTTSYRATNFKEVEEPYRWTCAFDSFEGTLEYSFDWKADDPPVIYIGATGAKEGLTAELEMFDDPLSVDIQTFQMFTFPRAFPEEPMIFRLSGEASEATMVIICWGHEANEAYKRQKGEYYTYE